MLICFVYQFVFLLDCKRRSRMSKLISSHQILAVSSDKVYLYSLDSSAQERAIDFRSDASGKQKINTNLVDCMQFSKCGKILALSMHKKLCFYDIESLNLRYSRDIEKTASCLRFFNKSEVILVADRSGCVTFFNYNKGSLLKEPVSFGHNSVLTDALLSANDDFVITSDRDEKIRVTHYPNVYNIQSYCLGHGQFVSSLSFLPTDASVLVSTSGDGTLRLWDFMNGKEVFVFKDENQNELVPLVKAVCAEDSTGSVIAVQQHKTNEVLNILVTGTLSSGFDGKVQSRIATSSAVIDIALIKTAITGLIDGEPALCDFSVHGNNVNVSEDLISEISTRLSHVPKYKAVDTIDLLFKREFNNVQDYLDRKKARLAEKGQ